MERDEEENFEKAWIAMESDMELCTFSELHKLMSETGKESETEACFVRMTQLKDRYGNTLMLATRQPRSNIILLYKVKSILCKNWYAQKKSDMKEESE